MSGGKYLVGDWGGTNFRAALSTADGIGELHKYKCVDFDTPLAILQQACDDNRVVSSDLDGFVIAAAGPVNQPESFVFPNNSNFGVINFHKLSESLGTKITLLNDFSAQAYGALGLEREQFDNITPDIGDRKLPNELWDRSQSLTSVVQVPAENRFLVAGPGTGLGICTLGVSGAHITVSDGEGGHTNFAAITEEEISIFQAIQSKVGLVSHEALATGGGLVKIYKAITGDWNHEIEPEDITKAFKNGEKIAQKTVRLFTLAFGRAVGNAALVNLTKGGVILPSGSIVSALGENFDRSLFIEEVARNDFNNTEANKAYNPASHIPVYIMKEEETGILGAHIYAQTLE